MKGLLYSDISICQILQNVGTQKENRPVQKVQNIRLLWPKLDRLQRFDKERRQNLAHRKCCTKDLQQQKDKQEHQREVKSSQLHFKLYCVLELKLMKQIFSIL